jgi:hypothetical protein
MVKYLKPQCVPILDILVWVLKIFFRDKIPVNIDYMKTAKKEIEAH